MADKILITGVAGFVGSNLAASLLKDGHEVVGVDNLSQGTRLNLEAIATHPQFRFLEADVRNPDEIRSAASGVSAIFHLAAYKIPRYGNAFDTLDTNVRGTSHCIDAAVAENAQLIFSSTSDVYGNNPDVPFTEQHQLVLGPPDVRRWAYSVSKAFDEHLLFAEAERRGLRFSIVRFFGGYGPHQALTWWGGPQSVFINHALEGTPMPVHGDGTQTRTFTHVDDLVQGLKLCLGRREALGEVFNVGATQEIQIRDLASMIWRMVRQDSPRIEFVPYSTFGKYGDVYRRVPDLTKSRQVLGFEPAWSLDKGLPATIEWQRERKAKVEGTPTAPHQNLPRRETK